MKQLIEQATEFLKGKIRRTPVEFSPALSELLGQPALFSNCAQELSFFA